MRKIIRNIYTISSDDIIKLNDDMQRLEIQFHNLGNDLVFINDLHLSSGKYLILNNLGYNDITWYKIIFQKTMPLRLLGVVETFLVKD
jgi:hypothetical protein